MSLKWVVVLAAAAALRAAAVRGNVVENQTGRSLSGAQVVLQPVPGTPGSQRSARADRFGNFEFGGVAAGSYVVKASRRGFMSMEYGQKRWNSAGTPVVLTDDGSTFLTIRLARYSGITGTVLDENEVGMEGGDVLAYRRAQPPELVARAKSDERGVYRISGLEPGSYFVRSAPFQVDDASYLPTFSRETVRVTESPLVDVYYERDTIGVDVRPIQGKLYGISGAFLPSPPGLPVTVTLASEMGRQTTQGPSFQFTSLPPGAYEIYGETRPDQNGRYQAAYVTVAVSDRDVALRPTPLQPVFETSFDITPPPTGGPGSFKLLTRRKDLAGTGPTETPRLTGNRVSLAPGRWEVMLVPPAGWFVSGFSFNKSVARPEGWNEVSGGGVGGGFRFSLASPPAVVRGVVKSGGEPAAGAPVYLESYDSANRRRLGDLRTVRTDARGLFVFENLAPGDYRILASFEYLAPGPDEMELAGARLVRVDRGEKPVDLELYAIP